MVEHEIDKALNRARGFRLQPIDPDTQVRLLRVTPRPQDDDKNEDCNDGRGPAEYSIEVVNVDELPSTRYRALSYMWGTAGTAGEVRDIRIGRQVFAARRNLADFLHGEERKIKWVEEERGKRGARPLSRKGSGSGGGASGLLFFIDALCINQLNRTERESQVRLMAHIFGCADEIVAWLGRLPKEVAAGTEKSRHQQCRYDVCALARAIRSRSRKRNSHKGEADGKNKSWYSYDTRDWTAAEWAGLHYLSHHPYWSRVWIVQEIHLAQRAVVKCGPYDFPLSLFAMSASPARRGPLSPVPGPIFGIDAVGRPYAVEDARERAQSPAATIVTHRLRPVLRATPIDPTVETLGDMTAQLTIASSANTETYHSRVSDLLHEVMRLFGNLRCTDSRDRLYGLLGLLHPRSRALICPDYTRDVTHTVYQALRAGLLEIAREQVQPQTNSGAPAGGIIGFGAASAPAPAARAVLLSRDDRSRLRSACMRYYCDVRDAFGLPDEQCAGIFRRVLVELGAVEAGSGAGNHTSEEDTSSRWWDDNDNVASFAGPIFRQLGRRFQDGDERDEGEDGGEQMKDSRLFKFHNRQYETAGRM